MKSLLLFLTAICLLAPHLDAKAFSRKDRRKNDFLKAYDVENEVELRLSAEDHTARGDFRGAMRRYEVLRRLHPKNDDLVEEISIILAALEYRDGNLSRALSKVQAFGRKYPNSPNMTKAIEIAFSVGMDYVATEEGQASIFSRSRAIRAFDFVDQHDPYSLEAAEGQLAIAVLRMESHEWNVALSHMNKVLRRQPATEISARTEVFMGDCYLRMHKGSDYDLTALRQARRYYSGYLSNYPEGVYRERAQEGLELCLLRLGRRQLDTVRYYCTARKWKAAQKVLEELISDPDLVKARGEAKELLLYVQAKLNA